MYVVDPPEKPHPAASPPAGATLVRFDAYRVNPSRPTRTTAEHRGHRPATSDGTRRPGTRTHDLPPLSPEQVLYGLRRPWRGVEAGPDLALGDGELAAMIAAGLWLLAKRGADAGGAIDEFTRSTSISFEEIVPLIPLLGDVLGTRWPIDVGKAAEMWRIIHSETTP